MNQCHVIARRLTGSNTEPSRIQIIFPIPPDFVERAARTFPAMLRLQV